MASACEWYLTEDDALAIDEAARKKHLTENIREPLTKLIERLKQLGDFTEKSVEDEFQQVIAVCGIGLGKLAQPVRVAVTGSTVSPPIFTVLEILGKQRSLTRLEAGIKAIAATS